LLPGKTEAEQLELIFRTIGTPTEQSWPSLSQLPNASIATNMPRYASTMNCSYAAKLGDAAMNLLDRILVADPARRSTPRVALNNQYFHTQPLPPADPADLEPLRVGGMSYHEYQTKQQRRARDEEAKLLLQQQSTSTIAPDSRANINPSMNKQSFSPTSSAAKTVVQAAAMAARAAAGGGVVWVELMQLFDFRRRSRCLIT